MLRSYGRCVAGWTPLVLAIIFTGSDPVSRASADSPLIALDVGHSLARPGATSARGVPEFKFNRDLALVVAEELKSKGFGIRLIGETGDADSLTGRTDAARGAAFFLSVHHDSVQPQYLEEWTVNGRRQRHGDRFSGYSLFVSRTNPAWEKSLLCARTIGQALQERGFRPSLHHAEPIPGENRPLADEENGVYFFDDLVVLKTATMPAVLLEAGIIVNRRDELRLRERQTQERIAAGVGHGLGSCLKVPRNDH
jgi:N-acetylmuramoyl-L-alanine amidase